MKKSLVIALVLCGLALPAAAQRAKAEATFDEGKVSISYGAPNWKEEFAKAMESTDTWRLGNNDPTSVELTCGLQTDDGAIPAGAYRMAMQKSEKKKWDLVVYPGSGHFRAGMKCWRIHPAAELEAKSADKLAIRIEKKSLIVHFGPKAIAYPFQPIKMHEKVETDFAMYPVKISVMAIPASDKGFDNTYVGTAVCTIRGRELAPSITWDLHLTMNAQGAKLAFVNTRAKGLAQEKAGIERTMKRVKGRLEGANDKGKKRITDFLAGKEKELAQLKATEQMFSRFKANQSVTGKLADRETPASTLHFDHERPQGSIVLTFGCGGKNAAFDVNPQEFRMPRRRR